MQTTIEIVSFGYLHATPPAAHLTVDLRHHFRDPHVSPELRHMTAHDEPVRTTVLATRGIRDLVDSIAGAAAAFAAGPTAGPVAIAAGCAGGRHRAPTVALAVAGLLTAAGYAVTVHHRDLGKPVVDR
ncbi:RNase adapter RapZ [Streptomyces heilongjiangensis]|uniref:RNase adapter RapZ n=1 Tax=Streptomyces heilongjiangensis TaxID=945052 RepID=A0ABW1B3Q8_9ACTN|nr:RNase adapter RapZ [Streptomyces heilongjiangensis]MDC2952469.1 RNase adapter RapZ [Streptomyces heilongjiangensis]